MSSASPDKDIKFNDEEAFMNSAKIQKRAIKPKIFYFEPDELYEGGEQEFKTDKQARKLAIQRKAS